MKKILVAIFTIIGFLGISTPSFAEFDWTLPEFRGTHIIGGADYSYMESNNGGVVDPGNIDQDVFMYRARIWIDNKEYICDYYFSGAIYCAPVEPGPTVNNPPEADPAASAYADPYGWLQGQYWLLYGG